MCLMKRYLQLIYHFEVLWASLAAPEQAQLIISMDVYPHKKKSTLTKVQLFYGIFQDFQESCWHIGQEDLLNKT